MKGTLTKKINGTWVVRVQSTDQHPSPSVVEHGVEYPLHPDDANLMPFRGQVLNDQHIMDSMEVEFEIVIDAKINMVTQYAKLINVDKLGNEDVSKLGYDVEKLAEEYDNETASKSGIKSFIAGYNKAKSTLYTEEQMIGFAEWIFNMDINRVLMTKKSVLFQQYIQSLKQPKQ